MKITQRIYLFFFTYMSAMFFAQTLLVLWISKNGYGFDGLMAYYLPAYLCAFSLMVFLPSFSLSAKRAIFFGIIFSALQALTIVKISGMWQLYLAGIFSGLNILLFWIPYNALHFKYTHADRRGTHSSLFFLITPIVGITLQPLTGVFADKFGFENEIIFGALLYLVPLCLLYFLPDFKFEISVRKHFFIHRFNWSTFFQGMMMRINYSFIPIFTLLFIQTPKQFGGFLGYLAAMAGVASVVGGHISDRLRRRKEFFYLFSVLAVLGYLPLAFVRDSHWWYVFAGIGTFTLTLANPFWLTFNIDHYQDLGLEKTMAIREAYLNLGYIAALALGFFVYLFTDSVKYGLVLVSAVCLLLPLASYWQGVYND